jgi:hypothetical protein
MSTTSTPRGPEAPGWTAPAPSHAPVVVGEGRQSGKAIAALTCAIIGIFCLPTMFVAVLIACDSLDDFDLDPTLRGRELSVWALRLAPVAIALWVLAIALF